MASGWPSSEPQFEVISSFSLEHIPKKKKKKKTESKRDKTATKRHKNYRVTQYDHMETQGDYKGTKNNYKKPTTKRQNVTSEAQDDYRKTTEELCSITHMMTLGENRNSRQNVHKDHKNARHGSENCRGSG